MAQRLVLNVENVDEDNSYLTLDNLKRFLDQAEASGLKPRSQVKVSYDTGTLQMWIILPEQTRKVVKIKKDAKIKAAVQEQIEKYKEDVKAGKKIAHVPPVKGTVKKKTKKSVAKKTAQKPPEKKEVE